MIFVKWIASDMPVVQPRGQRTNIMKKIYLALRFPAVLPEGVFIIV